MAQLASVQLSTLHGTRVRIRVETSVCVVIYCPLLRLPGRASPRSSRGWQQMSITRELKKSSSTYGYSSGNWPSLQVVSVSSIHHLRRWVTCVDCSLLWLLYVSVVPQIFQYVRNVHVWVCAAYHLIPETLIFALHYVIFPLNAHSFSLTPLARILGFT